MGRNRRIRKLLDWLAVEFMDQGWSLKELHRMIVNSAVYRQSSQRTDQLQQRGSVQSSPGARGSISGRCRSRTRYCLVRKWIAEPGPGRAECPSALARVHGPAAGELWTQTVAGGQPARPLSACAIYTFRFRSVPYPALEVFDAPNGDVACVKRYSVQHATCRR